MSAAREAAVLRGPGPLVRCRNRSTQSELLVISLFYLPIRAVSTSRSRLSLSRDSRLPSRPVSLSGVSPRTHHIPARARRPACALWACARRVSPLSGETLGSRTHGQLSCPLGRGGRRPGGGGARAAPGEDGRRPRAGANTLATGRTHAHTHSPQIRNKTLEGPIYICYTAPVP